MSTEKVNVYDLNGVTVLKTVEKPGLFAMELREDLVLKVHSLMSQNSRQPYAVSPNAGMQHSAESWGTGRAMARVPRVKGSGTRRAGQGAFANFCRKGRMAHPTKTHRRWHRKTPLCLRRSVTAMCVASTGNAAIIEARGHRISSVPMFPLVVSDEIDKVEKTKQAVEILTSFGLDEDVEKVKDSKALRKGKGKYRNRRFVARKGLLIIHDNAELKAFNNIMGVEMMNVNCLNLLNLAPGGKLGRLVLWTESAFSKLNSIFGTLTSPSELKKNYCLPTPMLTCDNLTEYFYSDEIQNLIQPPCLLPTEKPIKNDVEKAINQEFVDLYGKIVAN